MQGILCFGDSITFGKGEFPNIGWAGRLKHYFEPKGGHNGVYNLGIPGDTSTDLLKRFDTECKSRIRFKWPIDKYVIIIGVGHNDSKWQGMPEDNKPNTTAHIYEKNIKKLIKKAKNYKAKLAFIGLSPVDENKTLPFEDTSFENERVKQFNNIVKKCCKENNVLFLDMHNIMIKEDYPKLLYDGLHPNKKGYDFIEPKNLPLGTFSYGISVSSLNKVIDMKDDSKTEGWGRYFKQIPEFKITNYSFKKYNSIKDIRLTLDYLEDYILIKRVFKFILQGDYRSSLEAIKRYIKKFPKDYLINQKRANDYNKRFKKKYSKIYLKKIC